MAVVHSRPGALWKRQRQERHQDRDRIGVAQAPRWVDLAIRWRLALPCCCTSAIVAVTPCANPQWHHRQAGRLPTTTNPFPDTAVQACQRHLHGVKWLLDLYMSFCCLPARCRCPPSPHPQGVIWDQQ